MASMARGTRGGAPRSGLQISAGIKIDLTHNGFDGQALQIPSAVIATHLRLRAWRRLLHFVRNDDA